jgi:ABC-type lipoprotein release transport system permease subunit
MLINLSWKNIWRNRIRSGVILTAIALGLFSGTYLVAFMSGWMVGSVNNDVENHLSHIQIHDTAFMANNDINAFFIQNSVEAKLTESGLASQINVSFRLKINGMLASASNVAGVSAKCVDVENEKAVSKIWQQIPDSLGEFLPENTRMPIVISTKIAEKLKVKVKSKIVLTFADANGEMQSMAFRVGGIYKTTNAMLDEAEVFVRLSDVAALAGLPENAVHEAAIKVKDLETCDIIYPQVKAALPNLDVKDWKTISPTLAMSLEYTNFAAIFILGIFILALSFGIINTMLMAVLERTRELGMLGAIGMSKSKIFGMIMLETIFLTLLGSFAGIIAATLAILPSINSGIDLTPLMSNSFEQFGYGSIIYPVLNLEMFIQIICLVVLAGILSAVYPAFKALRLKPLEAMRK